MKILKNIIRYPIKGLSGEVLKETKLNSGSSISYDRRYALARFDTNINELSPEYLKKTNFLALVKDEKLALLKTCLDHHDEKLKLYFNKELCYEGFLNNLNDLEKLSIFFCKFLNIDLEKKPRLVRDKSKNKEDLKHSFSDIPDKAISLISQETIKDFESKIKKNINFLRFRGNFNYVGGKPWEEFDWVGKKIKIGLVEFEVFKRTQRCRATTVNPDTGERDINIPFELNKNYGHFDLGVYLRVIKGGVVKQKDKIEVKI